MTLGRNNYFRSTLWETCLHSYEIDTLKSQECIDSFFSPIDWDVIKSIFGKINLTRQFLHGIAIEWYLEFDDISDQNRR